MSEEFKPEELPLNLEYAIPQNATKAPKRDIFRFKGDKAPAVNLEHVSVILLDGKKITFQFHTTAVSVELDNQEAAAAVFEVLLNSWAG